MPIYGAAKTKTMVRSILPSSRRKGARDDLAQVKRAARHVTNAAIRALRHYELDELDDISPHVDLCFYPNEAISEAVSDRRNADKVMPITRWAQKITAELPRDERVKYLDGLLPKNIIGQHALYGHIVGSPGIPDPDRFSWRRPVGWPVRDDYDTFDEYWDAYRAYEAENRKAAAAKRRAEVEALRGVIIRGDHGAFNRALKNEFSFSHEHCGPDPCMIRLLAGLHDCEAWMTDTSHGRHREHYRGVLERFV